MSRQLYDPDKSGFRFQIGEITTKYQTTAAALAVFALAIGAGSMRAGAIDCSQNAMLARPIPLGVAGGNIDAFGGSGRHRFCFSGTLGSLVQDSSNNQYILSNNHVLDDINKAKPGQQIVQPGLFDTGCQKVPSDAVATFSRTVKIKFGSATNTIDAAIAQVEPGDVSPEILNIGPIASTVVTPMPGLAVQKMGSTTCLTTGTIAAVAVNGTVNYSDTGKKLARFVNQIQIDGDFSAAGDSGSLIVTQDSCPQAVGLLFAGGTLKDGTPVTIANPISEVLSGLNVSMVGECTPQAAPNAAQADMEAGNVGMSKEVVASAIAVRDRHEDDLMRIPGAIGTGIGIGDEPGQPAIIVYIKKMTPAAQAAAPKDVEGMPVKLIQTGGFVAY